MGETILSTALWALLLTLGSYQLGVFLRKKTGLAICNPIIVSIAVIIPVLLLLDLPNEDYQAGMKSISWLLTPCTVSMAIPLHSQLKKLRGRVGVILVCIFVGVVTNLVLVYGLCRLFGLDRVIMLSLLPKSTTTAMAIPLSENLGGNVALTTISVIVTGIFGAVVGPVMCKLLHVTDPIAQGVAYGTASHVAGTARAAEDGELPGAVSGLAMAVTGIMTAVVLSILTM